MAAQQAPPSLGFSRQEHWSGLPFPSPVHESEKWKWNRSVMSNSSRPHGLQPTRLLHPWDFPGKNTGVECHCLLHYKPRQHTKKQRHHFANKGPYSQRYGFSSSHVWMWELDHKGSWVLKNWCVWAVVLEKAMAPHSSTLAWKIPWMEEPGRLQSMGSLRVGHDSVTSLSVFTFMHWRRKWQPTPVFLPGESQGQGSLVGCHLWGRTELDTTEVT